MIMLIKAMNWSRRLCGGGNDETEISAFHFLVGTGME